MNLRDFENRDQRRQALEKEVGVSLDSVGYAFIDEVEKVHCENLIGAVTLPLGVAGPLLLNGNLGQKKVFIPLATTEGALVASINRGCKVITESGGATVRLESIGTTRGPVFEVSGIQEGISLKAWIDKHTEELKQEAEKTSSHLTFKKIEVSLMGRYVYLRCYFDTDNAMGMNMVTIATDALVQMIIDNTEASCIAVAGNYDVDKKPAWLNFISGRGRRGWGEIVVSNQVLKKVLKTDAQTVSKVVLAKCWGGSMMSGSQGYNAHYANITAAFFAATGQDLAHVVEGSMGITGAHVLENGDLYFSVYLPDIMVGTVGGGTKLKTQNEARSIMKVQKADEIAEIYVGAILAGELSLMASLAEGTLASSHKRLGR